VLDAATALGYNTAERGALRDAWKDVGVYCDGAVAPLSCDETYTTAEGEIASPQLPSSYPNGTDRTYCIRPDDGEPVTLVFSDFETEEGFEFDATASDPDGIIARVEFTLPDHPDHLGDDGRRNQRVQPVLHGGDHQRARRRRPARAAHAHAAQPVS